LDEDAAGVLPQLTVILAVVDQHVAWVHVQVLLARHSRDDRDAREMLGRPPFFLRCGPFAQGQASQDRRLQMLNGLKQALGIR